MSKEYRTFEEWRNESSARFHNLDIQIAFNYGRISRSADISAILGEFEALAGKWARCASLGCFHKQCRDDLSALIQSVKERM